MSGGDTGHLAMVVPITFLCNSLGAAGFIEVYVFLYMFHCNSQTNGALFVTEWKGHPPHFLILLFRLTTTKGLLFKIVRRWASKDRTESNWGSRIGFSKLS